MNELSTTRGLHPMDPLRTRGALVGLCALLSATACAGIQRGGGAGSHDGESVQGAITLENRSRFEICEVALRASGEDDVQDVELHPGGQMQLTVDGNPDRLFITECGGTQTLYGSPFNWMGTHIGRTELFTDLRHTRVVLYDPGQAPTDPSDHRAIELNPRPVAEWIFFEGHQDGALAAAAHESLVEYARRAGWSETFEFTILLSDWSIRRNELTGVVLGRHLQGAGFARWPDGHCTMQAFGFAQQYDGSDFTDAVAFDGTSTQAPIPCAALEYAAGLPMASGSAGGGASSSGSPTASAGLCNDTCRSANDGECDDGGPSSQYDVCSLGTDCSDCGAR